MLHRSRSQLDTYHTRHSSLHKPGVVPSSSRNLSPITSNRHKYEMKQKIWPKQTIESWFANHTTDDRRAVYSFLDAIYNDEDEPRSSPNIRRRKSPTRVNTPVINSSNHPLQRRMSNNSRQESRASKRDLGEILESLESFRPSPSSQEKGIQTTATPITVVLPSVNGVKDEQKVERQPRRSTTAMEKYTETVQPTTTNPSDDENNNNNKMNRRYLSQTWRVINPREDVETNVRPENNRSSFFNFTKKVYPEYFFIHPDWY